MKQISGWHIFAIFALGFGTIIAVNMTLAWNAVRTFPGLEVKNSYVASQAFDKERAAQISLNWDVSARLDDNVLRVRFLQNGTPIQPDIESAVFGRATSVAQDQTPDFVFDGTMFVAKVTAGKGNWNLRIKARSKDGIAFQRRLVVEENT